MDRRQRSSGIRGKERVRVGRRDDRGVVRDRKLGTAVDNRTARSGAGEVYRPVLQIETRKCRSPDTAASLLLNSYLY